MFVLEDTIKKNMAIKGFHWNWNDSIQIPLCPVNFGSKYHVVSIINWFCKVFFQRAFDLSNAQVFTI